MNRRMFGLVTAVALLSPALAAAQGDPEAASIRIGIVSLDPRIRVSDFGIDTNVFASADNPQRDVTATTSAGSDIWLRTKRGLLTLSADAEYVHFDTFASQRSFSSQGRANYELGFNRVQPFVWVATRDQKGRPSEEITARVRQYGTDFGAGSNFRVLSKSTLRMEWRRERSGFDDDAIFNGRQLKRQLDHTSEGVEVAWRQRLTALTSFVTNLSRERDEFTFEPARNADNFHVNGGFELGQFALIRGRAIVGYHQLRADQPAFLPEFSGLTANVDVTYSAPTATRIQAIVDRELHQSYDPQTPNYTQQAWSTAITQQIFGRWDVQLSGGRARQDFHAVPGNAARTDVTDRVGGGIGYEMANQLRASFNINAVRRTAEFPGREYRSVVGGFSVTYGY
jgi:hypothetical protein